MNDAFGHPQSVVVLGGTSDIARRVVALLAADRCRTVVLAGREPDALASAQSEARASGADTAETLAFDALEVGRAEATVARCFELARGHVDMVLMAVGELGEQLTDENDPDRIAQMITVNFTWPAVAMSAVAAHLRAQGHGRLVVLTSVAGVRVRRANFLYGSAKAGLDGYAQGIAESLRGSGVAVHIVRPGFVYTKMTADRTPAPFAVGPDVVASAIVRGMTRDEQVIWTPPVLRWVFHVFRMLPGSLWRRLRS